MTCPRHGKKHGDAEAPGVVCNGKGVNCPELDYGAWPDLKAREVKTK